jgi:hypothetical protein
MATKAPSKPAKTASVEAPGKAATTAVAKRPANNVVSIAEMQAKLRAQAASVNDQLGSLSGINISLAGKKFSLPDGRKTGEPIQLVILAFASQNVFYEGDYDPKNITPPACFAISTNPKLLTPSKNAPVAQATSCTGCPMNEFGSKGAGKACSNTRVLAVMDPDGDANSPIWTMKVSPTSLKSFDAYVRQVSSTFQMAVISVVTTVSFDEDKDFPSLIFSNPLPNDNLAVHFGRQDEAAQIVATEPDVSSYAAPVAKKPARAAARR